MVETGNQAGAKNLAQETSLKVFSELDTFPTGMDDSGGLLTMALSMFQIRKSESGQP
jgi:hypothetical protein